MIKNVVVDLGYAYIQAKNSEREVKFDAYIKQIPEEEVEEIRNSIDKFDVNHLLVKYNKSYYVLGKLAIQNYPSLSKRLIVNRYDEKSIVQYLTAISLLTSDIEILSNLVIGYPNRSRNEKTKAEGMFDGMFEIRFETRTEEITKIVRFEGVKAIPQSVSVGFTLPEENRSETVLIIDCGHGTVDISVLSDMQMSKEVGSRYFNRGIELIYKRVEELIYTSDIMKRHTIPKLTEKTIQGIIETGKWRINGVEQPEIKGILSFAIKEFADDLYSNIVANIVDLGSIDILLGGGAIFQNKEFTIYFKDLFESYGFIFATEKDPAWSVCHGLFNFANLYFEIKDECEETEIGRVDE